MIPELPDPLSEIAPLKEVPLPKWQVWNPETLKWDDLPACPYRRDSRVTILG